MSDKPKFQVVLTLKDPDKFNVEVNMSEETSPQMCRAILSEALETMRMFIADRHEAEKMRAINAMANLQRSGIVRPQ